LFNLSLEGIVAVIPALLIGFAFHEFAHGYAAYLLGDNTARNQGRLTLNPLAHLDLMGTLLIIFAGFGWAKPVPVNPVNFTRKITMRKGMMLVSLAGPMTNLIIAVIAAIVYGLMIGTGFDNPYMLTIISAIIGINVNLAIFNLLPIPPLDGSKILAGILPRKYDNLIYTLENYGMAILLLLFITGLGGALLGPPAAVIRGIMQGIVGLIAGGMS